MDNFKSVLKISSESGKVEVMNVKVTNEDVAQRIIDEAAHQKKQEMLKSKEKLPSLEDKVQALLNYAISNDNSEIIALQNSIEQFNSTYK